MIGFVAPGTTAPAVLPDEFLAAQGIVVTRFASAGWASGPGDSPASTLWPPRILGDIELSQVALDGLALGGRVALAVADIEADDADRGLSDVARYGTADGRAVTIRVAPVRDRAASDVGTPLGSAAVAFRGLVRKIEITGAERVRISLGDLTERLATPLQPTRYGGTGGTDGPTALAGRPKPVALGRLYNVTPVALGNIDLGAGSLPTYQTHWRAITAHDAVRIRGVTQASVGGTPTVGEFRDWPASGVFQLGSSPDGAVTADVRGDSVGGYVSSTAGILKRLLQSLGVSYAESEIDASAWTFADTDLPGEVGWYRGADEISAADAAGEIVAGSGAVLAGGRGGVLRLFDPLATVTTPQFDLPMGWIAELTPTPLPALLRPLPRAVAVDWRRNWTPLTELAGSVSGTVAEQLKGRASGPARASSALITSRVAQQRELRIGGLYWAEADALARAAVWRNWLEAGPRAFEITTDRYLGQIECGHVGRISYPAYGLDGGARVVVLGWRERLGGRRLSLTVITMPES